MMLKFDNTSAVLPRFSLVMPSVATQPVLIYSRLLNCCHLPHVLPIAFSRVDAVQIQHNTAFTLVLKGKCYTNWNFEQLLPALVSSIYKKRKKKLKN